METSNRRSSRVQFAFPIRVCGMSAEHKFFELGTGTLTAGVATLTTATLTAVTHSITAVYGGDATFLTSTSTAVSQVVNKNSSSSRQAAQVPPDASASWN